MRKQYIKPFTKAHTLNAEQPILAGSFKVDAKCYDRVDKEATSPQVMEEKNNYGLNLIDTKWRWGDGNDSDVD